MLGARFRDRMNVAVSTVRSGTQATLESYPGKMVISSATLAAVQGAVLLEAGQGMQGGLFQKALALGGGTIAMFVAQRFRDTYLEDEAGKEKE